MNNDSEVLWNCMVKLNEVEKTLKEYYQSKNCNYLVTYKSAQSFSDLRDRLSILYVKSLEPFSKEN